MDHNLVEALVLGVVQGVAEFLPVSSSGHLVIFGDLLQKALGVQVDESHNLLLNVALHVGTLASILVVYWRELWGLLRRPRLCWAIVVATVPAAVVGVLFKDVFETAFSTPLVAGVGLLVTAVLLLAGQRLERAKERLESISTRSATVVGLFQAAALCPGISRSGSTIAGALLSGVDRQSATTFSFLIAVPAIGGAAFLTAMDVWKEGAGNLQLVPVLLGAVTAFVVGVLSLRLLIRLVAQGRLYWFAVYCALLGLATVVWQVVG